MTVEQKSSTKSFSFRELMKLVDSNNLDGLKTAFGLEGFDVNITNRLGKTVLHHAAISENFGILEVLTSHPKIDLNAKDKSFETALMSAAKYGKARSVKFLLEKGADSSYADEKGNSALLLACKSENLECIETIMKSNPELSDQNKLIWTKEFMFDKGIIELAKKLIIESSDSYYLDTFGYAVLYHACNTGSLDDVKLIYENWYFDINHRKTCGITLLQVALKGSFMEIADYLILKRASLTVPDSKGRSTFAYAAEYDDSETFLEKYEPQEGVLDEIFKCLIEFSRHKTLKSYAEKCAAKKYSNGPRILNDALLFAITKAKTEAIDIILSQNSDSDCIIQLMAKALNPENAELFKKLHGRFLELEMAEEKINEVRDRHFFAAVKKRNGVVANYLLEQGVDPNGSYKNTSYLFMASLEDVPDLVESLIERGADVNNVDSDLDTALMVAACRGHLKIVKILLKYGADPHIKTVDGFTALYLSAIWGYVDCFFELFKVDRDLCQHSSDQTTLFLAACQSGNMEIVKALVDAGVCLTDVNEGKRNCLHYAAENRILCEFLFTKLDINAFYSLLIAEDREGSRPLDKILYYNYKKFISELLLAIPNLIDVIKSPICIVIHESNQEKQETCLICRDQLVKDDCAIILPCKHVYHEDCFKEWGKRNESCPYCQRPAKRINL